MRNLFQEGTYNGGVGMALPTLGAIRPLRMGQLDTIAQGQRQAAGKAASADEIATFQAEHKARPEPASRPNKLSPSRDRFRWTVSRLCSIMRSFSEDSVAAEVQSQVFWSYVKQANSSEESVLTAYKTLCPELIVPAKPVTPEKELVAEPGKSGFHGKTTISYAEAVELNTALTEVLRPLTPEEAASAIGKEECLRDFAAGNFPKLERLQDDLQSFIDAGDQGTTFTISKGDIVVAGKAIDCAVALGRGKIIKGALVAGGVIGAGALLLFLL